MHGNGCFQFGDGSEYIGEFYEGVQHGEGLLTTSDGTEMFGNWIQGVYVSMQYKINIETEQENSESLANPSGNDAQPG